MPVRYPRALAKLLVRFADPSGRVTERSRELSFTVEPHAVTWTSDEPGYADACTLDLSWEQLPIDPRVVSDMQVEVYADDVGDPARTLTTGDDDALRFVGYVDLPSVTFDSSGKSVAIEARDYSARLRDTPLKTRRVATDVTLSQALVNMAGEVPGYTDADGLFRLAVVVEGTDHVLRDVLARARWAPPDGAKVWDAMQALARDVGMVCEIDRRRLVIRPPRGLAQNDGRRVLYGRHVSAFTLERSLQPGPNDSIELRCLSATARRIVVGRYPKAGENPRPRNQPRTSVAGGAQARTKRSSRRSVTESVRVFQIAGNFTTPQLEDRARALYERLERRQAEGRLEAVAMTDLDERGLPGLRSGMRLYIDVRERDDLEFDRVRQLGMSRQELSDFLIGRGMDWQAATQFAEAWTAAKDLSPAFFVRRARHTLDRRGYSLRVDFEAPLVAE